MRVQPTRLDAYNLIHEGILALAGAEQAGMRIDIEYCENKKKELTDNIKQLEQELHKTDFMKKWKKKFGANYNINSDHQLGIMLYKIEKIEPPKTTASGAGSTDEESLKQIEIPELQKLLKIRKAKKLRDTYLDAFYREQVDGYLHPFFNLHTVRTYRGSSNSPNFQNIPKRDKEAMNICRQAIYPRVGHQLLEVDFSSLEVSIAACYHKDETMIKYLTDPNSDMHKDMAEQIFKLDIDRSKEELNYLRSATKNGFVFPQFYGDYYKNNAFSLIKWVELPQQGQWRKGQGVKLPDGSYISDHFRKHKIRNLKDFIDHMETIENDFWKRRFYQYQQWKENWVKEYQKKGYFDMYTGFRCSGVMRKNEVINYPVQGAAFHCLLWSFIQVDKILQEKGFDSRLIGQIHDAMLFDVHPKELEDVSYIVKKVTCIDLPKAWDWIIVPLDIDAELCPVDGSWNMKEDYELPKIK